MKLWRESGYVQDSDEDELSPGEAITSPIQELEQNAENREQKRNQENDWLVHDSDVELLPFGLDGLSETEFTELEYGDDGKDEAATNTETGPRLSLPQPGGLSNDQDNALEVHTAKFLDDEIVRTPQPEEVSSCASSPLSQPLSPGGLDRLLEDIQQDDISTLADKWHKLAKKGAFSKAIRLFPDEQKIQVDRSGRNLRRRKAEQLHPYAIELQRYRQTLISRGIKPVQIARNNENHYQDTQYKDDQEPTSQEIALDARRNRTEEFAASRHSSVDQSGPLSSSVSPLTKNGAAAEDEELPTLDAIVNRKVYHSVQVGHKRRKLSRHSSEKRIVERDLPSGPTQEGMKSGDTYRVPTAFPTPVRHLHNHGVASTSGFRIPPGLSVEASGEAHHTPATSVGSNQVHIDEWSSDVEDDLPPTLTRRRYQGQLITHPVVLIADNTNDSSSESSASESSNELKHAQRKIRGVLPASWLKLDQEAQKRRGKAESTAHVSGTRDSSDLQKGIARRFQRTTATLNRNMLDAEIGSNEEIQVLSSDPENEDAQEPTLQSLSNRSSRLKEAVDLGSSYGAFPDFDDMEDNSFDRMLPTNPRSQYAFKKRKSRQTRLTDILSKSTRGLERDVRWIKAGTSGNDGETRTKERRSAFGEISIGSSRQSKSAKHKPIFKSKDISLGILDSPSISITDISKLPNFIKVACRQARRRPNQGRQSPTRKFIRLQTASDTADANNILRDWRSGKIHQRPGHTHPGGIRERRPLAERSRNRQQRLPNPIQSEKNEAQHASDRVPEGQMVTKSRNQATNARVRQTKLNLAVKKPTTYHLKVSSRSREIENLKRHSKHDLARLGYGIYRAGGLESLENDFIFDHRKSAFRMVLGPQDRASVKLSEEIPKTSIQLTRFLSSKDPLTVRTEHDFANPNSHENNINSAFDIVANTSSRRTQIRKRRARRLDADTDEYRQLSESIVVVDEEFAHNAVDSFTNDKLVGLAPYGTNYPQTFDIIPLEIGTFFQKGTFIGSEEFDKCLSFQGRNFGLNQGEFIFEYDGLSLRWSFWTEDVLSDLSNFLKSLTCYFENNLVTKKSEGYSGQNTFGYFGKARLMFRQLIRYFAKNVTFLDPPDGQQFLRHILDLLHPFFRSLPAPVDTNHRVSRQVAHVLNLVVVLAYQLLIIAQQLSIGSTFQAEAVSFIDLIVGRLFQYLHTTGISEIREFLKENRQYTKREAGIGENATAVETTIILSSISSHCNWPLQTFWQAYNAQLLDKIDVLSKVSNFEKLWHDIFTVLPVLEFDAKGVICVGARYNTSFEDWSLVKAILQRMFVLYPSSSVTQSSTLNEYFRSVLTRCFRLVQDWGWKKCESMLNTVFDFFARRDLSPLLNEEYTSSPSFLEQLESDPQLTVQPNDKTFHVFLKILGTGLRNMQTVYASRKIRNIAYRFIPNHGRTYRKEEEIRQEDIDALRNHHDLLCTLYWASPADCRPRPSLLQNLVDHSNSHREVCRLNVRAWTRLAKFQLSRDEDRSYLEPIAAWSQGIISQTASVYHSARTEAEEQYDHVNAQGVHRISFGLLQSTIKANESMVIAVLVELVAGMKIAIKVSQSSWSASFLLQHSGILDLFKLLDSKKQRVNDLIIECLSTLEEFIKIDRSLTAAEDLSTHQTSEESQDYGDFPEFEDFPDGTDKAPKLNKPDSVQEHLLQLLSSCFGAEPAPADDLLMKTVEIWVSWAYYQVSRRDKQWENYLNQYSSLSWHQLRDTDQTRKFKPYYMALLLESQPACYKGQEMTFITAWLISLVERESLLKFQHRFTTALLHTDPSNVLLENLPFITSSYSKLNISPQDLRERRLSLLSSVLSNMRTSFEASKQRRNSSNLKRDYTSVLKQLMAGMKKNYMEIQQDGTIQGAYVAFVQNVVEFLQQYTNDVCPIDRFFTDSSAFPLPSTDPTYVVGRLKSYGLRLSETSSLKQLAVFIQTVSERAAVDGQQAYFVNQLCAAVMGAVESGSLGMPSLRCVLLRAIFPVYFQQSIKSSAGWILARPILQASIPMLQELPYVFVATNEKSVNLVSGIITEVSKSLRETTQLLIDHCGLLEQPHLLQIVAHSINAITALLPCLDYLHRRTAAVKQAVVDMKYFRAFSLFVAQVIMEDIGTVDATIPESQSVDLDDTKNLSIIKQHATRELNRSMEENWSKTGNTYVFQRGGMRREVVPEVGSLELERMRVIEAISTFLVTLVELQFYVVEPSQQDDADRFKTGELMI